MTSIPERKDTSTGIPLQWEVIALESAEPAANGPTSRSKSGCAIAGCLIIFVSMLVVCGCGLTGLLIDYQRGRANTQARVDREIIKPCTEVAPQCEKLFLEPFAPVQRGTLVVWDIDKENMSPHTTPWLSSNPVLPLPSDLELFESDLTVCLVTRSKTVKVGTYVGVGTAPYAALDWYVEVCVVYWPSREPAGRFWVHCPAARESKGYYGNRNHSVISSGVSESLGRGAGDGLIEPPLNSEDAN